LHRSEPSQGMNSGLQDSSSIAQEEIKLNLMPPPAVMVMNTEQAFVLNKKMPKGFALFSYEENAEI